MKSTPDDAAELRDGACHGLPHPPGGVGAEFEAARMVKFLHAADQAGHALLDEVGQVQAPILVAPRDADHQPLVAYQHL